MNKGKPEALSSTDQEEKKYKFYRKPSIKKTGPEVRQTKTSLKRFLIANPLCDPSQGLITPKIEINQKHGVKLLGASVPNLQEKNLKQNCKTKPLPSLLLTGNSSNKADYRPSTSNVCVTDFKTFAQPLLPLNTGKHIKKEKPQDVKRKNESLLWRSMSEQELHKNGKQFKPFFQDYTKYIKETHY